MSDSDNGYDLGTAYGLPTTYLDVGNIPRHEVLNFEGTPTQFSDDTGLRGILTRSGIKDVSSFNPIVKPGEKITADTPIQQVNDEGVLMFLSDPNDPSSLTTRNTGIPAISGTLGDQAYMREIKSRGGVFGPILGDFVDAAKDPYFHKFLAGAAALGGAGLALNAAYGVGGLGAAGATAIPVELGGTIAGAELGAGAGGAGGLGSIVGPSGAGEFLAADAAASAAGQGAFDLAAGLGMPLDQAVTSGLITGSGALTDAGAAALLGTAGGATSGLGGLSGSQLFQAARMGLPVVGSLLGGSRAGSGQGGQSGQGGATTQVSANGPWNTFMNPTMIRQEIVEQKPIMNNPELATIYGQLDPYLGNQLAQSGMIPANLGGGSTIANVPSVNYYSYGSAPQTDLSSYGQSLLGGAPLMAAKGGQIGDEKFRKTALGGNTQALFEQAKSLMNPSADVGALAGFSDGGDAHVPEFITGATGHYVKGRGDGQSDDIPAMLADGEYVFDADTVAQLGNGSSDAGAKVLDKMRQAIRAHKRSAPDDEIPPKAKSPLEYLKEGMKRK